MSGDVMTCVCTQCSHEERQECVHMECDCCMHEDAQHMVHYTTDD